MWNLMKCLDLLAVNTDEISFVFIIIRPSPPRVPYRPHTFSPALFKKTSPTIKGKFSAEPEDMNRFNISVEDSGCVLHAVSDWSLLPSISSGRKSGINVVRSAVLANCCLHMNQKFTDTFAIWPPQCSTSMNTPSFVFCCFFFSFHVAAPEAAPAHTDDVAELLFLFSEASS